MNTVLSDQQPRVSFLHYEELRALDKFEEKIHLWRSFFLVSSSLDPSRRTFSDREGGGGGCEPVALPLPTHLGFSFISL